jgi:hypothetical protein
VDLGAAAPTDGAVANAHMVQVHVHFEFERAAMAGALIGSHRARVSQSVNMLYDTLTARPTKLARVRIPDISCRGVAMARHCRKFACIAATVFSLCGVSAYAQNSSLPATHTDNGITYITGGIGSDQSDAMRLAAKNYSLRLTFAAKSDGAFLADVKVTIRRGKNETVISRTAEGPYFYAQLKPGAYTVQVDYQGATQSRKVQVPAKGGVAADFYW